MSASTMKFPHEEVLSAKTVSKHSAQGHYVATIAVLSCSKHHASLGTWVMQLAHSCYSKVQQTGFKLWPNTTY